LAGLQSGNLFLGTLLVGAFLGCGMANKLSLDSLDCRLAEPAKAEGWAGNPADARCTAGCDWTLLGLLPFATRLVSDGWLFFKTGLFSFGRRADASIVFLEPALFRSITGCRIQLLMA